MAPERLPKQMLFAFLPGDVGAPTKPGRRTGKWLSFDFVNDLELVAVPKLEWLHMARKNGGANWRQIVFQAAPWHQPKNPFKPLPELGQTAAKSKNLRPHEPRAAFWQLVQRQQAVLQEAKVSSGFLSMELKHGGETTFRKAVATWLETNGPDNWWDTETRELLQFVTEHEPWVDVLEVEVDLGLFLLFLRTIQHQKTLTEALATQTKTNLVNTSVKRRLYFKQARPACFPDPEGPGRAQAQEQDPEWAVQRMTKGMKTPKSRQTVSSTIHEEGNYKCAICKRVFPTKLGLASHIQATHTTGTFREEGFQCALCPRLFARQNKLTQHYRRDHIENSPALVCPHCRSVYPGEPMLRLHIAEAHEIPSDAFPAPCPLCRSRGDPNPVQISNVLTFKRHRTAEHLRDHEVLIWEESEG